MIKMALAGAAAISATVITVNAAVRVKHRADMLNVMGSDLELDLPKELLKELRKNPLARAAIEATKSALNIVDQVLEHRTKAAIIIIALAPFGLPFITAAMTKVAISIIAVDLAIDVVTAMAKGEGAV